MDMSFGDTLKILRIEKNMSQQQLAERLFVNRSSVANWETGRRVPDIVILPRLAGILGVDVSVLANAADSSRDSPEVIVVDDETILLQGAVRILSRAIPSATITGFSKVSEALEYARKNKVAIAFLDIELGKTNGLELCRTLTDINPLTNVIFLTSYPDYAVEAWNTLASGFIVKPLHLEDVMEVLSKLRHPVKGVT